MQWSSPILFTMKHFIILHYYYKYGTAHFKLDTRVWVHACGYTRASTRFTRVKVYNMACIFFVARGFVVRTCAIKHSWHTRHAPHEQTRHERTFS